MPTRKNIELEQVIAKIDNDFNLDNTDWVPRIAAWVNDALSILKCTPMETVKLKLPVKGNIAYSASHIPFDDDIKVYDKNGCPITPFDKLEEIKTGCCCCKDNGTDNDIDAHYGKYVEVSGTMGVTEDNGIECRNHGSQSYPVGCCHKEEYGVAEKVHTQNKDRYFVQVSENQIELSFDTDYVVVQFTKPKTKRSEMFGCDLPVIPNNGLLIEAITYYCIYKILCRGYKHPVFNLHQSQYGTNPYYMWTTMQEQVKRSVNIGDGDIEDNHAWDNAFYNFMFN